MWIENLKEITARTGCRFATPSPLLYILEKNLTHLRIYKEIKQLTRQ